MSTALAEILEEFKAKPEPGSAEPEILTLTERNGFMPQRERFKKRLALEDTSGYKLIGKGDIAFNPYLLWAGAIAQNSEWDRAVISPLYPTFKVRGGFDTRFVIHLLLTEEMIKRYDSIAYGSVPRKRRTAVQDFLNLRIPTPPPRPEQRRIAAILDHADALRSKRCESLTRLDELKQSIYEEIFGNPSTNRHGFRRTTIAMLLDSADYGTSEKSGAEGMFPVLRMNNITRSGRMDYSSLKHTDLPAGKQDRFLVRDGDILFNRTNSPELVGKTAVYRGEESMAYAGYLIRLRVRDGVSPDYISGYLNSAHGKAVLRNMCKSIVGMANINAREVQSIEILDVDRAVQEEYSSAVAHIELERANALSALDTKQALFGSLQTLAFRGDL